MHYNVNWHMFLPSHCTVFKYKRYSSHGQFSALTLCLFSDSLFSSYKLQHQFPSNVLILFIWPYPRYFRSCGLSQCRVQGPTPVLRAVPRSRAVAGLILKAHLHVLECGRRVEQPEEVHANMGRAFRLHSESDSRVQTLELLALRWQFFNIRSQSTMF